jgi:hypothetical protein
MFAYQMLDVTLLIVNYMWAKRVDTSIIIIIIDVNIYGIEVGIFSLMIRTTSLAVYLP